MHCISLNSHALHLYCRILNVVNAVGLNIPIPENKTSVVVSKHVLSLAMRNIQVDQFSGLTFSAALEYDSLDKIPGQSLSYERDNNSVSSIAIPDNIFQDINLNQSDIRIINVIYLAESLFLRRNESNFTVGGIIASVSIGNKSVEGLQDPIMLNFTKRPEVENATNASCNFWDPLADG